MSARSLPSDVADAMVRRLFDDRYPSRVDDILYPGCGDGALVEAVYRYCDRNPAATPPAGVAVDLDGDRAENLADRYNDIEARRGDYLHEEFVVNSSFDYILCDPPTRLWTTFTREQRRAYATNFGHVTRDDDEVNAPLLFVTQSIRDLGLDGRAVFITPPSLFDSDAASTLRERHYYRIDTVTELDSDAHDELDTSRWITTVTNDAEEWESTVTTYEPSAHEAALNTSIADVAQPFTAAAVMTPNPVGFAVDENIPEVYVDLTVADFDAAPVYTDTDERVDLQGYVSRESLRTVSDELLGEQIQHFDSSIMVQPNDGLDEVITTLRESRFVFVLTDDSLRGIITRFDLNDLPVYAHLYDCFSQFEIGLRELIRSRRPEWEEQTDIHVPYRGHQNIVSDRLACAELSTLVQIVREQGLTSALPSSEWTDLDSLVTLRNAVAHYNPIVHTMTERPTHNEPDRGAIQLADEYRFLRSCIDRLNDDSDEYVDSR